MAYRRVTKIDTTPTEGGYTVWRPSQVPRPRDRSWQKKKEIPRNDRFHDENGEHRTTRPEGAGNTWEREMRQHTERHATDAWVDALLKENG